MSPGVVVAVKFERLAAQQRIVNTDGTPSLSFTIYWQRLVEGLERNLTDLSDTLADIQAAMDAAAAAQESADNAALVAGARQPDVAPITVTADSSGTVNPDQLPRNVAFKRFNLTTDVTTTSAWSATLKTGAATFSIGAATGILNITALPTSSTIEVQSVRDGVTLTSILIVNKSNAGVGGGSGGGGSSSDSAFSSFNSTTHAAVSDELTVTAGAAGEVSLIAADLVVSTTPVAPTGVFPVYGKWQWDSTGGGVWVDVGTEDLDTSSVQVDDLGGGEYLAQTGILTSNETKTGLTPSSSHKFRFMARNDSGTRIMRLSGTVSAVGA